jgi:probable F420-dependent oxidoreductase
VYDVDYRHPVVLAKASATLQLLSGGRVEFGLGAGWMESDYREAGIAYDRIGVRIERLDEALTIIRSMWSQERTSFEGAHYQIRDVAQAAPLAAGSHPKILVGGGGRKLLAVAGRHADIVGINPRMVEGRVTPETPRDLVPERVREKVRWVREAAEAAGRDPDSIEFNSLTFVVALTGDPSGIRRALVGSTGMTEAQVADCPLFLTGSASEIRERLEKRREETGISYIVVQGRDAANLEPFAAQVVAPLAGR